MRWFRPVAYSTIGVLALMAIFAKPAPQDAADDFVQAAPRHDLESVAAPAPRDSRAAVAQKPAKSPTPAAAGFSPDLFAATPVAAAPPPPPAEPVAAPVPELKVLGWMTMADGEPQVFVDLAGQQLAVSPGQNVGDAFRFDRIGGGSADFTYLPTGEPRSFPVSDPSVSEP